MYMGIMNEMKEKYCRSDTIDSNDRASHCRILSSVDINQLCRQDNDMEGGAQGLIELAREASFFWRAGSDHFGVERVKQFFFLDKTRRDEGMSAPCTRALVSVGFSIL